MNLGLAVVIVLVLTHFLLELSHFAAGLGISFLILNNLARKISVKHNYCIN